MRKRDSENVSIDDADEVITVTDRASRRRFIRQGSTFILGGATFAAALSAPSQALADCDQGAGSEEKKPEHAGNGSDNDSGAGADAIGCGRRYQDKPKLSRATANAVKRLKV